MSFEKRRINKKRALVILQTFSFPRKKSVILGTMSRRSKGAYNNDDKALFAQIYLFEH